MTPDRMNKKQHRVKTYGPEDLAYIQEETRRIKFEVMSRLGLKINPFSEEEINLIDKVQDGVASPDEVKYANEIYARQELDSKILADKVNSFLYQAKGENDSYTLMIH